MYWIYGMGSGQGGGQAMYPPPPCANTGLSKHGDPVFPHFWSFFGTVVFSVLMQ